MRLSVLAVIAVSMTATPVLAADMPDMIGKWVGTSRAVVYGTGGHYGDSEAVPQFKEVALTVEWTAQKDNRLIGTITSRWNTEPMLAVLSSDGTTMVTGDSDGSAIGRLVDADHFETCYVQTSAGADQIVVSCVDFARVKE